MADLQDAVNLYVSTLLKLKREVEDGKITRGAVSGGQVYVGGTPYDYTSLAPGRVIDGDVVMVARSENDNEVVILG